MPVYVVLLRGVNVGKNILKMERLREVLSELRFRNIRTYVQSGNVVLEADGSPSALRQTIEKKLDGESRLPITAIVRSAKELNAVVNDNPFLQEAGVEPARLHVTFLDSTPTKASLATLTALPAGVDRFRSSGQEIYLFCPDGYGRTKLSNNTIEKILAVGATTRNWNTVNKLNEMASE